MNRTAGGRDPLAGVSLVEMLVVLALFAVVGAAALLAVPGQRGPAPPDLNLLALKSRLDAVVRRTLVRGEPFAIWQGDGDIVVLVITDDDRWEAARDPRINPAKLISRHSRMSFERDNKDVFPVTPALVPERGERLRLGLGEDSYAYFNGLNLVLEHLEQQNAEAKTRRRVQPD